MKKLFKKVLVGALAASMLLSASVAVMAHTEMENMVFSGYDLSDWKNPMKIYKEEINGVSTAKEIRLPVAADQITWIPDGYESVYPYAGYSRMYLEGVAQDIVQYDSRFPQWKTQKKDYMWEFEYPYTVYQRQQTKVNDATWVWDFGNANFFIPDSVLLTKTTRDAHVVNVSYETIGFAKYDNNGKLVSANVLPGNLVSAQEMYKFFDAEYVKEIAVTPDASVVRLQKNVCDLYDFTFGQWDYLVKEVLTDARLSERNPLTGAYVLSDADLQKLIPVVKVKNVTAQFTADSTDGLGTKNAAVEFLKNAYNWTWATPYGVGIYVTKDTPKVDMWGDLIYVDPDFKVDYDATISWTAPTYELAEPYAMYQYLVINGIVFDGKDANGVPYAAEPVIVRHTGGYAVPEISWRFAFYQYPVNADGTISLTEYEAVEQRYVNGVPEVDRNGNYVYRVVVDNNDRIYRNVNNGAFVDWNASVINGDKDYDYDPTIAANDALYDKDNAYGHVRSPYIIDGYMSGLIRYEGDRVFANHFEIVK